MRWRESCRRIESIYIGNKCGIRKEDKPDTSNERYHMSWFKIDGTLCISQSNGPGIVPCGTPPPFFFTYSLGKKSSGMSDPNPGR